MKPKRLLVRIRQGNRANVAFNDLIRLLNGLDFELRRISGDHHLFKHRTLDLKLNLQPDRNGDAKQYQVRQVLNVVTKYNLELED